MNILRMTTRGRLGVAVAAVAAVALTPAAASPVQAAEFDHSFYDTPSILPARDGDIVRTQQLDFFLDPLKVTASSYKATRVMYKSRNRTGKEIAVTGSIIVPTQKWVGTGRRPIIGYAVGTQGIGDSCAPSKQFTRGFEYETLFMAGLLARGYAVAMTDYEGLGTEGVHTYMDRVSQGRAVINAVRAAQRLPGSGLDATNPVGFYGYSQGGGGASAAAELAATYGPELKVKGSVVGAVPADLRQVAGIDGSLYTLFGWFAIAGLGTSYGVDLKQELTEKGKAFYDDIENDCVYSLLKASFTQLKDSTVNGEGFADLIKREPYTTMIEDQRIGLVKPNAPVLVTHSVLDDVIPYRVGEQLAKDWCSRGATVRFSSNLLPLHVGGILANSAESYAFFEARFAGIPALSSCWRL